MKTRIGAVCVAASAVLLVTCSASYGIQYVVDGQTNVIGGSDLSNAVEVPISTPGEYTFTLTASDFKENSGNSSTQPHLVLLGGADYGANRAFTLNGVGDSKTLDCPHGVRMFFIDAPPWSDNTGSSTVELSDTSGVIGSYTVDAQTNVIGTDLAANAVEAPITVPGEYLFTLTASDFMENSGNSIVQPHVLVTSGADYGAFRTFSLNGVGDSEQLYVPHGARLIFVDGEPWTDNVGSSTVEIVPIPEPATLSLLVLGAAAILKRRRQQ